MDVTEGRVYAGMTAASRAEERRDRLLEAVLDLLGAPRSAPVTVRRVLERSGVAPRYFYEHFTDLEQLQTAVFDQLTDEAERVAVATMLAAPRRASERMRAVLRAMVDLLLDDPRKGHLLLVESLTSPVLGPHYAAAVRRFARLLAEHSPAVWRGEDADCRPVMVTARFALGGFTTTMRSVLTGELEDDRELLVDELSVLFLGIGSASRRLVS